MCIVVQLKCDYIYGYICESSNKYKKNSFEDLHEYQQISRITQC